MSVTATQRKTRRDYRMHGNSEFVRVYKQRGYSAIDGPTHAGREGEAVARGGDPAQRRSELSVSPKVGDQLGSFDLWFMLERVSDATPRAEGGVRF
jgi:hypothetical protein